MARQSENSFGSEHRGVLSLSEVYTLYVKYLSDLHADGGQRRELMSMERFVDWWTDLKHMTQERYLAQYQQGYAATKSSGREEAAALAEKYLRPNAG